MSAHRLHPATGPRPDRSDLPAQAIPGGEIREVEPEDSELPTTTELAEALGLDEVNLHEDVRDEERQRHPGSSDDPEDAGDPDAQIREFQHRLNGG